MTTIKATCPTCGEVTLTPEDIELRVDQADAGDSSYAFGCPACGHTVRKPADERVVRLLVSGGVQPLAVELLRMRFAWPALTHDDLLDFHTLLQGDDWLAHLLDSVNR
ncbi:MAG: hypothetical protein H0V93_13805 [Euzebyales bacterium]|jgi:predicted RNA-binding Zn-ribbon protein involved in translation (DUF1610 family)|nr:hypothetical protein [Euzebyales bacterium]